MDVVRASTFAAHALGGKASPKDFKVPVVGGHSGATIVPLYSQAQPAVDLGDQTLAAVINRESSAAPIIPDDSTDSVNRGAARW